MESSTGYSAGIVSSEMALNTAAIAFETVWIAPFCPSRLIQADGAFHREEFTDNLQSLDITLRPVPPRRHYNNVLESKHSFIRFIYLRLVNADDRISPVFAAQRVIRISNDLYGSHFLRALKLSSSYSRPYGHPPLALPADVFDQHDTLIEKKTLSKSLIRKPAHNDQISVGYLVNVLVMLFKQKLVKFSSARSLLSLDCMVWTVIVPAGSGSTMFASIEDVRLSIVDNSFALPIRNANDQLLLDLSFLTDTLSNTLLSDDYADASQKPCIGYLRGTVHEASAPFFLCRVRQQ